MLHRYLKVPIDNNQLLAAYCLAVLLPRLKEDGDNDHFGEAIDRLFEYKKRIPALVIGELVSQLNNYRVEALPTTLNGLIQNNLRPKLAEYIRETCKTVPDYKRIFESYDAELSATIQSIESGQLLFDRIVMIALARMTGIQIQVHTNLTEILGPTRQEVVHLYLTDNVYQFWVDPLDLPENLCKRLLPFYGLPLVEPDSLRKAKLQEIVLNTLRKVPTHLHDFSQTVPRQAIEAEDDENKMFDNRPTTLGNTIRFNPLREVQALRNDMPGVVLTTPFRGTSHAR